MATQTRKRSAPQSIFSPISILMMFTTILGALMLGQSLQQAILVGTQPVINYMVIETMILLGAPPGFIVFWKKLNK